MREALASTTLTSLPREASDLSRPPEHSDRFDSDALGNFCAAPLLRPLEKPGRTWRNLETLRRPYHHVLRRQPVVFVLIFAAICRQKRKGRSRSPSDALPDQDENANREECSPAQSNYKRPEHRSLPNPPCRSVHQRPERHPISL